MTEREQSPEERRQELEADYTFARIAELGARPVEGKFDAAHLKEINRRIFQDLPGLGFTDVKPGQVRDAVAEGKDWMKNRGLATEAGTYHVAYSRMDAEVLMRLDLVLEEADPAKLGILETTEFAASIARLYAELDYVHPFGDGNSRTFRVFTRQLAEASGFQLDWNRFGSSPKSRDELYMARDRSVNTIALPRMQEEHSMRRVIAARARLAECKNLEQLLQDAVRPLRSNGPER